MHFPCSTQLPFLIGRAKSMQAPLSPAKKKEKKKRNVVNNDMSRKWITIEKLKQRSHTEHVQANAGYNCGTKVAIYVVYKLKGIEHKIKIKF